MSVLAAKQEKGRLEQVQRDFHLVYAKDRLNKVYQKFEQEFNCLCSNWDWFTDFQCQKDPWQEVQNRIEQN